LAADPLDVCGNPSWTGGLPTTAAMVALATYLINDLGAVEALDEHRYRDHGETVASWNDHEGRRVAEVVAALRGAAKAIAS
jgi:hypothetical protein